MSRNYMMTPHGQNRWKSKSMVKMERRLRTKDEVKKVIKMKAGKALGIDALTTEHLMGLDDNGLEK